MFQCRCFGDVAGRGGSAKDRRSARWPAQNHCMPPVDTPANDSVVRHLRQVLLWPLRLMPDHDNGDTRAPWQRLRDLGATSPWQEQVDEYTGDSAQFHERHYNEFVTFLPYVQRFLYG